MLKTLQNTEKEWFSEWFDSPYYHLLYKNRDYREAEIFIDNLLTFLAPPQESSILDLACGRGRHAVFLSQKNFQEVIGIDLSKQSIQFAKTFESQNLKFFEQDMRQVFKEDYFDYIFNMFTSFGYLESDIENLQVLKAATKNLKKTGKLVIDFLNPEKTLADLLPYEVKTIGGISFEIKKYLKNGFIFKEINFSDNGNNYQFFEKLRAFSQENFFDLFQKAELKVLHTFGNYQLQNFDKKNSERMIFIVEQDKH